MKNIYFIIAALIFLFYIIHIVKKDILKISESFWWVVGGVLALLLAIFPNSIDTIASWFGVSYPPTLLLVFCILFLLFMNFRMSLKVSEQSDKIMELTEHISIIKSEMSEKK